MLARFTLSKTSFDDGFWERCAAETANSDSSISGATNFLWLNWVFLNWAEWRLFFRLNGTVWVSCWNLRHSDVLPGQTCIKTSLGIDKEGCMLASGMAQTSGPLWKWMDHPLKRFKWTRPLLRVGRIISEICLRYKKQSLSLPLLKVSEGVCKRSATCIFEPFKWFLLNLVKDYIELNLLYLFMYTL